MRKVEKEANFALRRTERMQAGPFEALFSYVVFQLPSGWGLYTWQPIALIFLQIPIFFTIFFFLSKFNSGNINIKYNSIQYEDVTYSTKYILIFSIVSNFNFSWKNFNVSGWLSPIFLGEAILEGTFWIGVVSRIQGFISLYLFATWVLMYFAEVWQ
jgi:hypothetical protein